MEIGAGAHWQILLPPLGLVIRKKSFETVVHSGRRCNKLLVDVGRVEWRLKEKVFGVLGAVWGLFQSPFRFDFGDLELISVCLMEAAAQKG